MHPPDLNEQLEQLRAQTDRLRAVSTQAAPLRIRHELQHTTDRPLRELWIRAERGELTLLEVLASAEYQRVHGRAYQEAFADYLRARDAGDLPDPAELDATDGTLVEQVSAAAAQLRADLEQTEQTGTEPARDTDRSEPPEFVYRPRITDR